MRRRLFTLGAVVVVGLGLAACETPPAGFDMSGSCVVVHNEAVTYGGNCPQAFSFASPPDVVMHTPTVLSASTTVTVPTVSCGPGLSFASFWAGIDGRSDPLEQDGVELICAGGNLTAEAFVELFPAPVQLPGLFFSPGDTVTASVAGNLGTLYTFTITDDTTGQTYTTTQNAPGATGTAGECISENPGGISSLIPFGTVVFSSCQVNGATIAGHAVRNTEQTLGPLNGATGGFSVTQAPGGDATGWTGYET